MSDPQRYEMVERTRGMETWHELEHDPEGEWMLYDDHVVTALRVASLEAAGKELAFCLHSYGDVSTERIWNALQAWLKAMEPHGSAGTCCRCGGPVNHRDGKPGEFDHSCNGGSAGGSDNGPSL